MQATLLACQAEAGEGQAPRATNKRLRPPSRASLRAAARQRAGVGPRARSI